MDLVQGDVGPRVKLSGPTELRSVQRFPFHVSCQHLDGSIQRIELILRIKFALLRLWSARSPFVALAGHEPFLCSLPRLIFAPHPPVDLVPRDRRFGDGATSTSTKRNQISHTHCSVLGTSTEIFRRFAHTQTHSEDTYGLSIISGHCFLFDRFRQFIRSRAVVSLFASTKCLSASHSLSMCDARVL